METDYGGNYDVNVIEPHFEDIQKWIIQSVNEDVEKFVANLQGKSWVNTKDYTGYATDPTKHRWMNDRGISMIRDILAAYASSTTMLGNISEYEYETTLISFSIIIVREVGDNKVDWEISDGMEDTVVDTIVDLMRTIMTRPRGGLDRTFFNKIQSSVTRIIKGDEKEKPKYLGPYGG